MHRNTIKIFGLQFALLPFVFVMVMVIILILLGNWQIRRLSEKRYFIDTIEQNIKNPPVQINNINNDIPYYSKIKIIGQFLPAKFVFLYGKRSASTEKDGYYLLSPFRTEGGTLILVSRGWIPQSSKNNFDQHIFPLNNIEIQGITLPGEKRSFLVPKNDINKNIWFNIDLDMAQKTMEIDITSFYLMQIESDDLPKDIKPLSANNLSKVRNDHMEYAITWYSLAICLLVLFFIYGRIKIE